MQLDTKKLMTIHHASSAFHVDRSTLYRRIESGTLSGYEVNNKVYVNAEELVDWKEKLQRTRREGLWGWVSELWKEGMPDSDIARKIGRSRERVRQIRNELGKPPNPRSARLPKGTYIS